nr:MAG TPA: hypothetical protein [Caudoviricetes sp.]
MTQPATSRLAFLFVPCYPLIEFTPNKTMKGLNPK